MRHPTLHSSIFLYRAAADVTFPPTVFFYPAKPAFLNRIATTATPTTATPARHGVQGGRSTLEVDQVSARVQPKGGHDKGQPASDEKVRGPLTRLTPTLAC